jgi:hypothetical protein
MNMVLQVEPQLMPVGLDVTVPAPDPDLETVSVLKRPGEMVKVGTIVMTFDLNLAVQLLLEPIVTTPSEQSASPDQPSNDESTPGVAVSVTTVPVMNMVLQVEPQLMPEGEEVTVPAPVPDLETVSVLKRPGEMVKVGARVKKRCAIEKLALLVSEALKIPMPHALCHTALILTVEESMLGTDQLYEPSFSVQPM